MVDLGVVMPVYKQKPEFLEAAIQSIRTQTWNDFRFIIVIDGAPEMEPLVRAAVAGDPRAEVISYADNRGVAQALNTGFELLFEDSSIAYLTWVSSDNLYRPAFLETLRAALHQGPEQLGVAYSSFQSIDDAGRPLYAESQLAMQRKYQAQPKELLLDSSLIGVSFMYKSCYAKLIDGYGLEPVEDYDYWLRLTEHCDIRYIPEELIDYRVDSAFSISASLKSEEKHRKWRYAYHLARHLARNRRKIALEVTILLTVKEDSEGALQHLENLYEQTYSNYKCCVLDLSPDQQATERLSSVSHPVTTFTALPEHNEISALVQAVAAVQTPYVMAIGPQLFYSPSDLQVMVNGMRKAGNEAVSNYFHNHREQNLSYRYPGMLGTKPDIYNELFHTSALIELLKPFRIL